MAVSLSGFILGEGPDLAELGASRLFLGCYNDPLFVRLGLLLWGWPYWDRFGMRPSQDMQRREDSLWSKSTRASEAICLESQQKSRKLCEATAYYLKVVPDETVEVLRPLWMTSRGQGGGMPLNVK